MSADQLQTTINRMSLVMNVAEDIARACKKAEIHPELAAVLMKMHTAQQEMEKEINEMRKLLFNCAKMIDRSADLHVETSAMVEAMTKRLGFSPEELFTTEKGTE